MKSTSEGSPEEAVGIVEGLPEEAVGNRRGSAGRSRKHCLRSRRAESAGAAEEGDHRARRRRSLVETPWKVLILGGVAISLLAASFYLIAIGVHAAFDTPRFKR